MSADCKCPPCPGRGTDGHGMNHCAECCFGSGVEADMDCPKHGRPMTDATEFDEAAVRRDVQVVREHIPSGYHVAHRVADAVPLLLDEITRLRAALDEARADRDAEALRADDLSHEIVTCDRLDLLARAVAAESALAAVRALVGPANPRSATAGSAYSTGRWDAFAEVRAVLESEVEDGVFGDPEIHARLTSAALATPTTPEETQPVDRSER